MPPQPPCSTEADHKKLIAKIPVYTSCVKLDDDYCLSFDTTCVFFYLPLGHFMPELPMGVILKGTVPNVKAIKKGEVAMFIKSVDDDKAYVQILTVSDPESCAYVDEPCD